MSLHIRNIPKTDQVAKFTDHKGEVQQIAVQRLSMRLYNINHPVISLALFQEVAYQFKRDGLIIPERLVKVPLRLPIIQIESYGEKFIIDGKHRYVKAFLLGDQLIRAYCVKPVIWRQYIVKGRRNDER